MPFFRALGKRRDSRPSRSPVGQNGRMTSQSSSSGLLGEEAATHRRIADGALFRAGPDDRAETFSSGNWVPAGWKNADLLQSMFTPLQDRTNLGATKKKEP
jgi:hypothetical protein